MSEEFTTEELKSEQWRAVVGFESLYEVSSLGRVRSLPRRYCVGRVLKPSNNDGYRQVVLCRVVDGARTMTTRKIHVLVTTAFLGSCPAGKEPNHIDRCRSNNRLDNLEYVTRQQNIAHSIQNQRHHLATLNVDEARAIRRLDREGRSAGEIAAMFPHVDRKSVYNVRAGRTWKYLP